MIILPNACGIILGKTDQTYLMHNRFSYAAAFTWILIIGPTAEFVFAQDLPAGNCSKAISWTIGTLDSRYDLTNDELKGIIEEATRLWSDAAGQDLFTFKPDPSDSVLKINLIYSTHQNQFDEEELIADSIRSLQTQYFPKQVSYRNQLATYQQSLNAYHDRLDTYNEAIDNFNESLERVQSAGARTAREQERLDQYKSEAERIRPLLNDAEKAAENEERRLIRLAGELNQLADLMNEMMYRQNRLLETWSAFKKGSYINIIERPRINIYQFDDPEQLKLILAHELGHALGIPHIENRLSVMYYRAEYQSVSYLQLTDEDVEALLSVCGNLVK